MTLWDEYNKLLSKRSAWDFYCNNIYEITIENTSNKIFTNKDASRDFIRDYFNRGGKSLVTNNEFLDKSDQRNIHTVSLYFLGLLMIERIVLLKGEEYKNSLYEWYMTCLYHDLGYWFENKEHLKYRFPNLNKFIKMNLKSKYKKEVRFVFKDEKELYKLCCKYYKYRIKKFGKLDHGITGGVIYYWDLVNNYYHILKNESDYPEFEWIDKKNGEFNYKERNYSKKLFANYKKAARAIILHNLWIADKNSIKEYIKYKLLKLIPNDFSDELFDYCTNNIKNKFKKGKLKGEFKQYTVDNKDDYLLFMLCLADTIEPLKYYKDIDPEFVLSHIEINLSNSSLEIIVKAPLVIDGYFKTIKDLEKWLKVKVTPYYNTSTIEIDLSDNFDKTDYDALWCMYFEDKIEK